MRRNQKIALSAVFLAIGMVLPLLTMQLKEIGDTLLPMHFPVMICGFLCGPYYGLAVGLLLPFLRSIYFGMPPMFPNACWMSLELASYGFLVGLIYQKAPRKSVGWMYIALITAMILGRIVWGVSKTILLGVGGKSFPLQAFLTGGFLDAIPGILLQLIFIPLLVSWIERRKINNEPKYDEL